MTFKRFISKKRRHIMAAQVHIENLGSPVSIGIKTGINGQVSNEGVSILRKVKRASLMVRFYKCVHKPHTVNWILLFQLAMS